MNDILTKLVLTGEAVHKKFSFYIQEITLPAIQGRTRIVYSWEVTSNNLKKNANDNFDILCALKDQNGKRVHFVRDLLYFDFQFDQSTRDITSAPERSKHDLMFVSESDLLFSWGGTIDNMQQVYSNPGIIREGANRPLGINNVPGVFRKGTPAISLREYDFRPTDEYADVDGFNDQVAFTSVIATNAPNIANTQKQPFSFHTISYLDVNMSADELKKWVLNHG